VVRVSPRRVTSTSLRQGELGTIVVVVSSHTS
jgi:hypothetical protein